MSGDAPGVDIETSELADILERMPLSAAFPGVVKDCSNDSSPIASEAEAVDTLPEKLAECKASATEGVTAISCVILLGCSKAEADEMTEEERPC